MSLFCDGHLPLTIQHSSLCISTVSQEPYYIFVLHLYQTTSLFDEIIVIQVSYIEQLLHSDCAIMELSLQL